ncbi:hypothetical protein lerEdw1_009726 [Lerista edwardsae]|nr:hypothetical protein lerEdw1_009726 [Lerista edwardsae]
MVRYGVLSPSRLQAKTLPVPSKKAETLSPPHLNVSPDPGYPGVRAPNLDSTSPFNESWPSTERSSSTPEGGNGLPTVQASETKTLAPPKPQESASDSESVIARYIERFRYGQPTNRRERWASSSRFPPLWWLDRSFSPEGNISKKEAPPSSDSGGSEARPSPLSSASDRSASGESHETSNLDLDTVNLQERAARLLHRSASPSSSSKHVSSEGLSFTSTFANADVDTAGNGPRHLAWHQHKDNLGAVLDCTARMAQSGSSLKAEDDILFQWRLRRKMEEASKAVSVLPPAAWRTPFTLPTCAPCPVIAERLFSSPEPPAPPKDEHQRSTMNRSPEEAVPQAVSSPSHPQLLSMAAQLLEQAEDSDGTEFEDDPLLQVLRGQREFLRHQLR